VAVVVHVRGRTRELQVELLDQRTNERIDWECSDGIPHSGAISFHRLAPRLTRVELTIKPEQEGLIERLARAARITDRTVHDELHRFKAFAELLEDPEGADSPEVASHEEQPTEAGEADEDDETDESEGDEQYEPEDDEDEEFEEEPIEAEADEPESDEEPEPEDEEDEGFEDVKAATAYDDDFEDEGSEDVKAGTAYEDENLEDEGSEDEEIEEDELEPVGSER
jgi:hypothetical protein